MSKIEWTGQTWNPVIGCSKASPGCDNCYAEIMAVRQSHMRPDCEYSKVVRNQGWHGNTAFVR